MLYFFFLLNIVTSLDAVAGAVDNWRVFIGDCQRKY